MASNQFTPSTLLTLTTVIASQTYTCLAQDFYQPPVTVNTYGGCSSSGDPERLSRLEHLVMQQQNTIITLMEAAKRQSQVVRDCEDIMTNGNRSDGVYNIQPRGSSESFPAYCQFDYQGAWTVIQQRNDGYVDFQRSWVEYKNGFGVMGSNAWLGNEKVYAITNQRQYKLRIEITDWDEETHYAEYKYFRLDGEENKYAIHYANYTGTAGDSLGEFHNGMRFSTFDQDNDLTSSEDCAVEHGGGWWYRDCDHCNLNGYYNYQPTLDTGTEFGIEWDTLKRLYSFKRTLMKIKAAFPN